MNKIYLLLTSIALVGNSYSQISNKGILKIKASTVVSFNDEYTNSASGIHDNDGDLYLNSNFINDGTTKSASGTTYFNSAEFDIQNISGLSKSINFYNLEVGLTSINKKGLLIADHFSLTVANKLSISSGDLILMGDSQLLQTHSGVDANTIGTGNLLIDQQGVSSTYNYFTR